MDKQTPNISKKNPNWIEKQRYYELKHFCLQYPYWQKQIHNINLYPSLGIGVQADTPDPVLKIASLRENYIRNIELIEKAAAVTSKGVAPYILRGVTEGLSYDAMMAKTVLPCSRDVYYELYRKFFWTLDKLRG